MRILLFSLLVLLISGQASGQTVTINVKTQENQKPVSPYIYGRNNSFSDVFGTPSSNASIDLCRESGLRFTREGRGNNSTKYNWRRKMSSHPDWYNNVYDHNWDNVSKNIQTNIPSMQTMWSFQLIGKVAANKNNNFNDWAYNQSKWWSGTGQNLAGGGEINPAGGNKALKEGDPSKYLMDWNADSTTAILPHFFGEGGLGLKKEKFIYWSMDNEPEIWSGTHDDVMPTQIEADSFMTLYFETAKLARERFPEIKLTGPVPANEWQWYKWGSENIRINGQYYCWLEYFIKRVADEQKATGIRLLDVLDIHFYPSEKNNADILQLHRVFFDKTYNYPGANGIKSINGSWDNSQSKEYIMQRINDWLVKHLGADHGVGLGLTEMDIDTSDPNIRSLFYASMLGTFANHGVEVYSPWSWGTGMWETLHLFSRYAKNISVSSVSSLENTISAYSTINTSADSLTVILVNRDQNASRNVSVNISDMLVKDGTFETLTLSSLPANETFKSHTSNALKKNTVKVGNSSFSINLPALSTTAVILHGHNTSNNKKNSPKDFRIYPNPASQYVTITTGNTNTNNCLINIYKQNGQLMESHYWNSQAEPFFNLNIEKYKQGIYLVQISNKGTSSFQKLVVAP